MSKLQIVGDERNGYRVRGYVEPNEKQAGMAAFFGLIKYATFPCGQVRWFSRQEDAQRYINKREKFESVRLKKGGVGV